MKKDSLSKIAEIITLILLILTALVVLLLPFITKWILFIWDSTVIDWLFRNCLIILYPSGILALLVVWNCYRILSNINREQPFIMDNANRIKRIALLCLPLAIIFLVAIFLLKSPSMIIISFALWIISAYAFIMGKLFKQAVIYKEENDLTI